MLGSTRGRAGFVIFALPLLWTSVAALAQGMVVPGRFAVSATGAAT